MTYAKRPAKGTVLQLSIATVYTTVAGISSIDEPSEEALFYDTTSLDSTAVEDGALVGLNSPGTCTVEGFADPLDSTHQAFFGAVGVQNDWKIINANLSGYSCTFSGALKSAPRSHKVKDYIKFKADIKLDSVATVAP